MGMKTYSVIDNFLDYEYGYVPPPAEVGRDGLVGGQRQTNSMGRRLQERRQICGDSRCGMISDEHMISGEQNDDNCV